MERFINVCRDPNATFDGIVGCWTQGKTRTVVEYVEDDALCARVLNVFKSEPFIRSYAFCMRSLAFYERYKDTLFQEWTPSSATFSNVMRHVDGGDPAKVAFLISRRTDPDFFRWWRTWESIVELGMNHENADVRRQFPAVSPVLAGFLLDVPPRVKCRVLKGMIGE